MQVSHWNFDLPSSGFDLQYGDGFESGANSSNNLAALVNTDSVDTLVEEALSGIAGIEVSTQNGDFSEQPLSPSKLQAHAGVREQQRVENSVSALPSTSYAAVESKDPAHLCTLPHPKPGSQLTSMEQQMPSPTCIINPPVFRTPPPGLPRPAEGDNNSSPGAEGSSTWPMKDPRKASMLLGQPTSGPSNFNRE
eukprot:gene22109-29168_t